MIKIICFFIFLMGLTRRSVLLLAIAMAATLLGSIFAFSATFAAQPLVTMDGLRPKNSYLSAQEYDRMKNCSTDNAKQANYTEYLTHFN
ncbi:MAG: hypothetical protein ACREAY_11585, partial [Nitrososphaera sp.]